MDSPAVKDVDQLYRALGKAVVSAWGNLPHDVQQDLFERAVESHGELAKQQLAIFLHGNHPRTSEGLAKARDISEPDSLGG